MPEQLTFRDYIDILRRRWLLIAGMFLVIVLLALVFTLSQTQLYRATANLIVNQDSAADAFDPVSGDPTSFGNDRVVENEMLFAASSQVEAEVESLFTEVLSVQFADVLARPGNQLIPPPLTSKLSTADVFSISIEHADPEFAALMANTYAQAYVDLRRNRFVDDYTGAVETITTRLDEIQEEFQDIDPDSVLAEQLRVERSDLRADRSRLELTIALDSGIGAVLDDAIVPAVPFSPNRRLNIAGAAALGLLLGVGLALLLELLDNSIRSKAAVEAITKVPNLAIVPSVDEWRRSEEARLESLTDPKSNSSEAYRALRAAVDFAAVDREVQIIQVTSAMPSEGKSTTAANLAVAMARSGRTVLLIDADLRKPRTHQFFRVDQAPGFTSVIARTAKLSEALVDVIDEAGALQVLTAGEIPPGPSELLGSQRAGEVLHALKRRFDIVVLDSAPVLPVSDSLVLSRNVDATILVVNGASSKTPELRAAVDLLNGVDAPLVGTVLNQVQRGQGGYGYGYGYGYGADE